MTESKGGPELVNRRDNRKSSFKMGRTIGEKRERLETANERAAARKKDKKRQAVRTYSTIAGFAIFIVILGLLCFLFFGSGAPAPAEAPQEEITHAPTVNIVDEDSASGGEISNRMTAYIGQAEQDFRDLNYKPTKVVVPTQTIREVDFYLEGYTGRIKLHIDRDTAVSVEDADRMIRYLAGQGINDFEYIDVRIDGKAYWK